MGKVGLGNPFRIHLCGQSIDIPGGVQVTEIETDESGEYVDVYWKDLEESGAETEGDEQ